MKISRDARRIKELERQVAELERQIAAITTWLWGLGDHADLSDAFDMELILLGLPPRPTMKE